MKRSVILSGPAGFGLNTLQYFFETLMKQQGLHILSYKNYMSRIRGGFNFMQITVSDEPIHMVESKADTIVCLNQEGYALEKVLKPGGTFLTFEAFKQGRQDEEVVDASPMASDVATKAKPMMALGAMLKQFGLAENQLTNITMKKWPEATNSDNIKAARVGYEAVKQKFELPESHAKGFMRINGNQAVALGAMAADMRFYSAYPMAPSTGIMMTLSRYEKKNHMVVEQVEDEIAALLAALGASSNGVRAMTGTSGGGFSLMVEGLGFAGVAELPIVIANVQRPGPATGLPTRTEQADLSFIVHASQGEFPRMVIAPTDIEACYYETQRAFNIADKYQMPVIILTDQYLADATQTVPPFELDRYPVERHINMEATGYKRYDFDKVFNGRKYPGLDDNLIMNDSHTHDEHGKTSETIEDTIRLKHRLMSKLDLLEADLKEPIYEGVESPKDVFIAWGSTAGPLREAMKVLVHKGHQVGALLFTDVFPVPQKSLRLYHQKGVRLINVEQNYNNQFGKLMRGETGIGFDKSINRYDGRPMTADDILDAYEVMTHE